MGFFYKIFYHNKLKVIVSAVLLTFLLLIFIYCGDDAKTEVDKDLSVLSTESNLESKNAKGIDSQISASSQLSSVELSFIRQVRLIPTVKYDSSKPYIKGRLLRHRTEISAIVESILKDYGINSKDDILKQSSRLEEDIKIAINEFLKDHYPDFDDEIKEFFFGDI